MFRQFGFKGSSSWGWLCAVSLLVFLAISGCVISPRRLPGDVVPGTSPTPTPTPGTTPTPTPSPTPTPTPVATPTGKLYVSNSGANSIVRFDQALTANGNATPATTIIGASTQLNAPEFMFLDAAADRLYVANTGALSVLIFDHISAKTGNAAPERAISGATTTLISPTDVSVDKVRDLLYVADDTDVAVFAGASTATGDIPPTRIYTVSFTISAILIDAASDRLYLADSAGQAINVYDNASTLAAGPITANRTITGANTHLTTPSSMQIDGSGRLVVSNASPPSITIYSNAAGANGNVPPAAEITGSNTGFNTPDQIVVDHSGTGTLYNADPGAARIAIFGSLSSATGNIAPTRAISGASTTLTVAGAPVGVALDTTR